jgi:hypothetical protein
LKKATQKIQPQTPIRTTSISNNTNNTTGTNTNHNNNNNNNNNSSYHSVSSSSPSFSSSSSSSSSAYDTGLLQHEPQMPKQEELNEAIKRVAAEHLIKRQSQQSSDLSSPIYRASLPNGNGSNVFQLKQQLNNQVKSSFHVGSAAVKNELERALENRLRKQQQQEQSSQLPQQEQQTIVNKRNVPRDPPPPVPSVESNAAVVVLPQSPPPPPPPPMVAPLFSKPTPVQLLSNNSCSSFPPPPSPLALRRLSTTTIDVNPNISNKSPISPGPPPPPPPLPASASPTLHVSVVTTPPVSTPSNLNVKSIINNYQQTTQQLLDPRTSSDFSELIAKKAAEKRAKFQETKPLISNAVTFQPDGSKVFATTTTTTNNNNNNNTTTAVNKNIDNSITNNKFLQPQPLANNTNTVNVNLKKTNTTNLISTQVEKHVNISNISNGHAQVSSSSLSFSSSSNNSSSSPSMSSTFSGKKK